MFNHNSMKVISQYLEQLLERILCVQYRFFRRRYQYGTNFSQDICVKWWRLNLRYHNYFQLENERREDYGCFLCWSWLISLQILGINFKEPLKVKLLLYSLSNSRGYKPITTLMKALPKETTSWDYKKTLLIIESKRIAQKSNKTIRAENSVWMVAVSSKGIGKQITSLQSPGKRPQWHDTIMES